MRIAIVVYGGVPNPAQNGSTLTVWTVIRHLLAAGHEVETVVVGANEADDPGARLEDRVERLRALGAGVHLLGSRAGTVFERMTRTPTSRVRRSWRPSEEELLPNLLDAEPMRELCEELRPDVAYVYHWRLSRRRAPCAGSSRGWRPSSTSPTSPPGTAGASIPAGSRAEVYPASSGSKRESGAYLGYSSIC